MRHLFVLLIIAAFGFTSCGNNATTAAKPICDTTCNTDSFNFKGDHPLHPTVMIGVNKCKADSMMWMHDFSDSRLTSLPDFLGQDVSLNKTAIDCYFKDTSYAWLQFNDCVSGRGYALKLAYDKKKETRKITSALNRFDPKFSIDPDLIVYTDKGSIFIENKMTGQQTLLPFDKPYMDIDFNKLHDSFDSLNITKTRAFAKMIRDGQEKTYEKKLSL